MIHLNFSFFTFNTDWGKIGILICYDVEFPQLSRILADDGMDILFAPFLSDTQNGFSRVRKELLRTNTMCL